MKKKRRKLSQCFLKKQVLKKSFILQFQLNIQRLQNQVLQQDPEQYIKNSDPNLYKPYNTFFSQMYKVIVKFWLQIYQFQNLVIGFDDL